jgi:hypothetical protein
MPVSSAQLQSICRVPTDGRSALDRLITATEYREIRPELTRDVLAEYLARHPKLVFDWLRYSEARRGQGEWQLMHPEGRWIVSRLSGSPAEDELRFGSGPEACAEFILRELDSVAGDPAGTRRSS